mgnify:CR=1 FL=1|tara:strand:- start:11810 stop:12226 length:417 start_codon:yes stop_codon:yes gene_type:complete
MKRDPPDAKPAEDAERLDPVTPYPDHDIRPNDAEKPVPLQPAPDVGQYNARPTQQDTKIRRQAREGTYSYLNADEAGPQKRTKRKSSPDSETNKPSSISEATQSPTRLSYLVGSEAWVHGLANEVAQLPSLDEDDGGN